MMRAVAVLPTYDEAQNLPELAGRLLALRPAVDVLVVDDCSPDGTGELAEALAGRERRVHVMHRQGARGYAGACVDGLRWALDEGYDAAIVMDADLSHDPAVIPQLLERLSAGADVAIGSRYVDGGTLSAGSWGVGRTAISRLGSRYARAMIGTPVRDCTSGFRCYSRAALESARLDTIHSGGYSFVIELLERLTRAGARVDEVPIEYVDRKAGESKISSRIVVEALVRSTGLGLRRLFRSVAYPPASRARIISRNCGPRSS